MLSAQKTINSLLEALSPRQKEVILGRFGLEKTGEMKTLAEIGEKLVLTRERVRQIEESALNVLGETIKKDNGHIQIISHIKKQLEAAGGALNIHALLENCRNSIKDVNENQLALLAEASKVFHLRREDENFKSFFYLNKNYLKEATDFAKSWISYLKSHKDRALSGYYGDLFKSFIQSKKINKSYADSFIGLSKEIHVSNFGEVGLASWPEIRPATARDRAYLVLKKTGKPLHFETIAAEINKAKLGIQLALAPTVHNELIKDDRFVLVGRGIYALREQGYEPGVAREVIAKVLKKNGPLHQEEIIDHVGKQRLFKPNTVIINLQNKTFFERLADGRYRIRES